MILINKASAGSGKTYTLVKEYLIMLLGKKTEGGNYILDKHPNDNHRYILAITFTKPLHHRFDHDVRSIEG